MEADPEAATCEPPRDALHASAHPTSARRRFGALTSMKHVFNIARRRGLCGTTAPMPGRARAPAGGGLCAVRLAVRRVWRER